MPLRLSRKAMKMSRDALRTLSSSSSSAARRRVSRAAGASVEALEQRQLLTAVVGGLFQGTGTQYDGQAQFEYQQGDGTNVRISIFGNVTAEFIGGRTPDASFDLITRDLVPAGATNVDGVDLFSIYVLEADINSVIAIAVVPPLTNPARFMDPFGGSAGQISVFDATTGVIEQVETGPGGVYLGARTHDFQPPELNDRPIITPPDGRRAFGLRPSSAGQMFSGLECAPGVNLGKFMLGGTITGLVDIPGSVRLFYAGTILTGDAGGLGANGSSSINNNFFVGGDIEHLVTGSSIGTSTLEQAELEDIAYKTGFDLQVNGRVGWIRALDSYLGSAVIRNLPSVRGLGIAQEELEYSGEPLNPQSDEAYFDPLFFGDQASLGTKTRDASYDNDSFDTAQYLGTLFSTELDSREVIQLRGFTYSTRGDSVDYYAIGLVAGQTAQVQLLESATSAIGVFDPDGRLIATDYSNVSVTGRWNKPFRFTADRPGAYRIVVGNRGDVNFNETQDPEENIGSITPDFYELRIQRVANIALGGLVADFHVATTDAGGDGLTVERGDVGGVRAGISGAGTIFSASNPWAVHRGNLRSVEAVSMGIFRTTPTLFLGLGPDFLVQRGTIGLLRTTGTEADSTVMFVNQGIAVTAGVDLIDDDLSLIPREFATGVDIQLVDCASNLQSNLLSNRAIGVIRAAQVTSLTGASPGAWVANVDGVGDDGRFDLIDVQNNFGELGPGGPAIATGPGGNVRYMHVGGEVFRDRFFGGGAGNVTNFQPGERVELTDDNGTAFSMQSVPLLRNVDPTTGFPTTGFNAPGFLSVLTYPVRDKAGSILVRVTANPGTAANGTAVGRGVEVTSGARGRGGSVEFGEIVVLSPGTALQFDPFTRVISPTGLPVAQQNSDVILGGSSPIDVWNIEVRDPTSADFSGSTNIANGTSGEVVNVRAAHIAGISANSIGLARSSTGAAVNGVNVQINAYPFNQQRNLIVAQSGAGPGHIGSLRARQGIGSVFAAGTIGSLTANADGRNVRGVFEGINGVILATHVGGAISANTGNIVNVSIGEGIAASGSGNVSFAGLYANGQIDRVLNTGAGSDIHGDIISLGETPPQGTRTVNGVIETTPDFFIGDIILRNGAIIDADVMTVVEFEDSREFENLIAVPQRANVITAPVFQIRSIQVNGIGGLMSTNVTGDDIGLITIDGGFGVIASEIGSLGDSVIDGIVTDGYGIRASTIQGGANVNRLVARGTGKRLDTRSYTSSVRNSENQSFDPFTGHLLDGSNDLHKFLGTTRSAPKRKGLSDAGVIEDTTVTGQRTLGLLEAHRVIGRNVFTTASNGKRARIPFGSVAYPMRVSFGEGVQEVRVRDVMDGLALTGGGVGTFSVAGDVHNTAINVTGRIGTLGAGALRGTTSIKARGPQGTIDNITTKRSLFATIESSTNIGTIKVGTDLGSPSVSTSRNLGLLSIDGSVLTGANVRVARVLGTLDVGRDVQSGATIRADEISNQEIGGQVLGDIIIT